MGREEISSTLLEFFYLVFFSGNMLYSLLLIALADCKPSSIYYDYDTGEFIHFEPWRPEIMVDGVCSPRYTTHEKKEPCCKKSWVLYEEFRYRGYNGVYPSCSENGYFAPLQMGDDGPYCVDKNGQRMDKNGNEKADCSQYKQEDDDDNNNENDDNDEDKDSENDDNNIQDRQQTTTTMTTTT